MGSMLAVCLLIVGCTPDKETDDTGVPTTDADADADADADSDADADTDTDTDTDTTTVDTATDTGTPDTGPPPPPPYDCYALFETDGGYPFDGEYVDGVADTTGFDAFDPVATDQLIREERDQGADGTVDVVNDYTYDADGRLLTVSYHDDYYGDQSLSYTYDADGNLVEYTEDQGSDGVIDLRQVDTYDVDGNLIESHLDTDGDGVDDAIWTYQYDAGLVVTSTVDADGDGNVDTWYTYTYDAQGRETEVSGDDGNDGSVDYYSIITYSDPVLDSGEEQIDVDNDGTFDVVLVWETDAAGNYLYYAYDTDADGIYEQEQTATYDGAGNPLTVDYTLYDDYAGFYDIAALYAYDGAGRITGLSQTLVLRDFGNYVYYDGDSTWTYGGTCP
ncbi:MAG: hypothetical protein R3F59_37005 [Myxococcota bacterium]